MTARVVKLKEVRRGELLDCAEALFLEVGYEATTIADIIARARVSKGGFYHHFDSKEALLEAITERMMLQLVANLDRALADAGPGAVERLKGVFARNTVWNVDQAPLLRAWFEALSNESNAPLNQRIIAAASRVITPVVACILAEGVEEGVFTTPDVEIAAEIVLNFTNTRQAVMAKALARLDSGDIESAIELLEKRWKAEGLVIDHLLGLPPGSIQFDSKFPRQFLEACRRERVR